MNYFAKLEQLNQLKSVFDKTIYTNDKYYILHGSESLVTCSFKLYYLY